MASRSIFVAGGLLVVLGLIMIPLPSPGYLIVSLGLLVLVVGSSSPQLPGCRVGAKIQAPTERAPGFQIAA